MSSQIPLSVLSLLLVFTGLRIWRGASRLISFFFNDTATPEIYTLSLHDALPIWPGQGPPHPRPTPPEPPSSPARSEEHTSELQSLTNLVCRLLLEKKKQQVRYTQILLRWVGVEHKLVEGPAWESSILAMGQSAAG